MELVRCKILEMSIRYGEFGRRLGWGATIDLDQVVGSRTVDDTREDVTVRDLIRGREDCFEPAAEASPAAPQPPTTLDVDEG